VGLSFFPTEGCAIFAWDRALFFWWNGFAGRNPVLDGLAALVAQYLIFGVAALMVALMLASPRGASALRRRLVYAGLAAALALGVNYALAAAVPRPRPFVAYPHAVHLLIAHAADASFPSDHVAVTAAVAFALMGRSRLLQGVLWAAVALIALARVFVGVHWPSDVIGGAAVGALCGGVVLALDGVLGAPVDALLRLVHLQPGAVER